MVASRAPIEPVSNFTSILSVPALAPISFSHLCIRSITACLCPNRASTCQRAMNMDILLDYGCAGLVGPDASAGNGVISSHSVEKYRCIGAMRNYTNLHSKRSPDGAQHNPGFSYA